MSNFAFFITDFCASGMVWQIRFGVNKIDIHLSNDGNDALEQLLLTVLCFHPNYEPYELGWGLGENGKTTLCKKIVIDEVESTVNLEISVADEDKENKGRVLRVNIARELNKTRKEYSFFIDYYEFAKVIMQGIDSFVYGIGFTKYSKTCGSPFPLNDYINAKAVLMNRQTENIDDDLKVLTTKVYVAFMEEPIRKITLTSKSFWYGSPPKIDEIIEQRLTINAKGRVNITAKNDCGSVCEQKCFYEEKDLTQKIIQSLVDYFQTLPNIVCISDSGAWELIFENEEGVKYKFNGTLYAEENKFLGDVSNYIREWLKRRDLFLFDGNTKEGLIFLSCVFENSYKSYYYLTEDETIRVGDYVKVPVGNGGKTAIVEVVDIEYFKEEEVPFSLDKVKSVIEKVDEFKVYQEDVEEEN